MLFSIEVISQQFQFRLNNPVEQTVIDVVERANTFEFVGYQNSNNPVFPYKLILSKSGVFVSDTVYLNSPNSIFTGIINSSGNEFLSHSGYRRGDKTGELIVNGSGATDTIILQNGNKQFFIDQTNQLNDSIFISMGSYTDTGRFAEAALWVVNIMDTSKNKFIDLSNSQTLGFKNVFDIIKMKDKYIVTAFGVIVGNPISWTASSEIIVLDQYFQIDTAFNISYSKNTFGNNRFAFNASLIKIDDQHFMVSSRAANPRNANHSKIYDMGAIVYDTNFNEVSLNFYGLPDSNTIEANRNSSRYMNNPFIFIGGVENNVVNTSGYPPDTTLFMLTKTDLMGNEIWTRYYSNNTNLFMHKVLATSDGGALMVGWSYDPAGPDGFEKDVWIVKVDSNGNYLPTSIKEQQISKSDFNFYPNPLKNELHFRQINTHRNYQFELFDVSGRKVAEEQLTNSDETINISHLNTGTYIYHLMDQKGNYATGKLIKE